MDERKCATNLLVLERAEPSGLRSRILCHPRSDRLNDDDVGESSHDRFATGSQLLRFHRHHAERALDRFQLRRVPGVYRDDLGQQGDEPMSRGVIETNRAASDGRRRAAAAMPKTLGAIADLLGAPLRK